MALKQTQILEFPGVTEDTFEVFDGEARDTANNALSTANSKLKTATLQTEYAEETKTLKLTLLTNTQ